MRFRVSQATGIPFYRQLKDQIADGIRTGKLPPGERLPSVRELAAELLVSVITIKKAYADLEAQGLVASHQGRGTFVAPQARAASQAQLAEEVAAEIDAAVQRAAELELPRTAVESAFEKSLRTHFVEDES